MRARLGRLCCRLGFWLLRRPPARHVIDLYDARGNRLTLRRPAWDEPESYVVFSVRRRVGAGGPADLPPGWTLAPAPEPFPCPSR